ncbi:hypothetical protein Csa_011981, partial [Cucumis sativus]|uniref:Uncharacterized protein n=1 Tax=Cucumis sativus TaxID=3659 RepID=A0A0A0L1G4_CUCSA
MAAQGVRWTVDEASGGFTNRDDRDGMKGLSNDALALARRTTACTAAGLRRTEKRKMVAEHFDFDRDSTDDGGRLLKTSRCGVTGRNGRMGEWRQTMTG